MAMRQDLDTGDPNQNLANAIIEQAATDWRRATAYLKAHPRGTGKRYWEAEKAKSDCERFFLGETFEILTDLDGAYLLRRLRKEAGEEGAAL